MLYNIVWVSAIYPHEPVIGIHVSPPSCASLPPSPHLTPLGCRHRAPALSSLCHTANFHLLSNFTHSNVHVSMLLSQVVPPSPSPPMSTSLFFTSASPLCPADGFISNIEDCTILNKSGYIHKS